MIRACIRDVAIIVIVLGVLSQVTLADAPQDWDLASDTWEATDSLGRAVSVHETTGPPRSNRTIGLFYFLWMGAHVNGGPYDVSKILAAHPDAMQDKEHPAWGPMHAMHFWGEPLFGYYRSDDPWVLRKHGRMLADALVDVIIFDVTNRHTYREAYTALCEAFSALRREGTKAPAIAFLCPFWDPRDTAKELYRDLYEPGLHRDLWFQWEGKPLLMADPEKVDEELRDFFTFRKPVPSYFTGPDGLDQWGWLEVHPQHVFRNSRDEAEQMTVGVAQNAVNGRLGSLSERGALGRSFHGGRWETGPQSAWQGFNFMEQWSQALEVDPQFIFITGWNEWIAMRFDEFNGIHEPVMFVDQFNHENSRDIEPMRGGHGDAYYYQMADYIRRYKGARPQPLGNGPVSINLAGDFSDWADVVPVFRNHRNSAERRNHPGYGEAGLYVDETGRNDIVLCKVAYDDQQVYFYVETSAPLSPHTDPAWMRLFIDAGDAAAANWEGFDFVVNRMAPEDAEAIVERCEGGWNWREVDRVPWRKDGNRMHLALPRAALGLEAGTPPDFRFKWADNMQSEGDPADFTLHGDAAPPGRFTYRYRSR